MIKRDTSGEVTKNKARLIARGFIWIRGIKFIDTYTTIVAPIY